MHNRGSISFLSLIGVVFFCLLTLGSESDQLAWGQILDEVSIEGLYEAGVISVENLVSDNGYYLRPCRKQEHILYLKRGRGNQPFSLNTETLEINMASDNQWDDADRETVARACNLGDFISEGGIVRSIVTGKVIEPSGRHVVQFCVSPNGKLLFVYSFSGYYQESKGIGTWISTPSRKIGFNVFELWNIETRERKYKKTKISFSRSYWPQFLFWLEKKRLLLLSNNYNKSLLILRY